MKPNKSLKHEIGDGLIQSGWGEFNGEPPKFKPSLWISPVHVLPNAGDLSESKLLLVGVGFAPDKTCNKYRPLFMERSAVQTLWPCSSQELDGDSARQSRSERRKRSQQEIEQTADKLYERYKQDGKRHGPNQNIAAQEIMEILPGAKRDDIRAVLKKPKFADHRAKAGNQPKR
jgi:hypothetical protein